MINLIKVTQQEEQTLHHIMQFYIYEFSKYMPVITLETTGKYQPFDLGAYWNDENLHAYFIKKEEELIGFALIKSETMTSPNTINEFFVIQKYAGRGFGKIAATKLFTMFPGKWYITQSERNYPAQAFWRGLISTYTNGDFSEKYDEKRRSVQEFDTKMISDLK